MRVCVRRILAPAFGAHNAGAVAELRSVLVVQRHEQLLPVPRPQLHLLPDAGVWVCLCVGVDCDDEAGMSCCVCVW